MFALRRVDLAVLPPGAWPIRVLHLSDLHIVPGQQRKIDWVSRAGRPAAGPRDQHRRHDVAPRAVPAAMAALDDLLDLPGAFVFGNNDFYAPTPKSPHQYFLQDQTVTPTGAPLPWQDLRAALSRAGLARPVNAAADGHGPRSADRGSAGVDDPFTASRPLRPDRRPARIRTRVLRIGVTHAPEPRVLDLFAGRRLRPPAGRPHPRRPGARARDRRAGHQLRHRPVPGAGPVPLGRRTSWLNVSAGLGTSPYLPMRFACRPEATLITLLEQRSPEPPADRELNSDRPNRRPTGS